MFRTVARSSRARSRQRASLHAATLPMEAAFDPSYVENGIVADRASTLLPGRLFPDASRTPRFPSSDPSYEQEGILEQFSVPQMKHNTAVGSPCTPGAEAHGGTGAAETSAQLHVAQIDRVGVGQSKEQQDETLVVVQVEDVDVASGATSSPAPVRAFEAAEGAGDTEAPVEEAVQRLFVGRHLLEDALTAAEVAAEEAAAAAPRAEDETTAHGTEECGGAGAREDAAQPYVVHVSHMNVNQTEQKQDDELVAVLDGVTVEDADGASEAEAEEADDDRGEGEEKESEKESGPGFTQPMAGGSQLPNEVAGSDAVFHGADEEPDDDELSGPGGTQELEIPPAATLPEHAETTPPEDAEDVAAAEAAASSSVALSITWASSLAPITSASSASSMSTATEA